MPTNPDPSALRARIRELEKQIDTLRRAADLADKVRALVTDLPADGLPGWIGPLVSAELRAAVDAAAAPPAAAPLINLPDTHV